jgi:hypothetical protein
LTIPGENSLARDAPSAEVAKIYRHICILRAGRRGAEADQLTETDYAAAVAAARQAPDAPADFEAWLGNLERSEASRVAEVAVFSEILAPMVGEYLREHGFAPFPAGATSFSARQPTRVRLRSAAPPDIADFIDTMLEQERGAPCPS